MTTEQNVAQQRLQTLWDLLKQMYGSDICAATLTILVDKKHGQLEYTSMTFPQQETRPANEQ